MENLWIWCFPHLPDLFLFITVAWPSRADEQNAQKTLTEQDKRATQVHRKNIRTAGQKISALTHWQKPEDVWQVSTGNLRWLQEEGIRKEEDAILPYRRLGADISFPNLVEGTCPEASRTYPGKLCGHLSGKGWSETMEGRMKFPQVRRWSGKRRMGSYNRKWPNQKKKKREKGEETQKSLLIRFPGYDDQECHPSWIYRFRNGFQRRKEGRMI